MEKKSLYQRILFNFSSVSLVIFGLMAFVPWSIYFGNCDEFSFIFRDFVYKNILYIALSIFILTIIFSVIPRAIGDHLAGLIAGLGLCIYFQSMFMNCYLGTMNGNELEWDKYLIWGIINLLVWIVVIFSYLPVRAFFPSIWSKIMSYICLSILTLEIAATFFMVFLAPTSVWERTSQYSIDGSKQFQFSKEKNIIILIFDTLGSGYLKQVFIDSPELKDGLKDFIWYSDARSNYFKTFPGLCHELTGTYFLQGKDAGDFYRKSWHSASAQSFYEQVKNAGYDLRFYVNHHCAGPLENFHDYFSNVYKRKLSWKIDHKKLFECLFKMSGFSSAPFIFKRFFYYSFDFSKDAVCETDESNMPRPSTPYTNVKFYSKLIKGGISADASSPIMSFHYTTGVHRPWKTNEKCQGGITLDTPFPTTKSCIYIVTELIRLLKENDIYNQTAIVILSDHGGDTAPFSTPFDMTFMIKPFDTQNDYIIEDNSKIQSIDILPTLLFLACKDNANLNAFDGIPMHKISKNRSRHVFMSFSHPKISPFFSVNGKNLLDINCFAEFVIPASNSEIFKFKSNAIPNPRLHFLHYIPLNINDKTSEDILNEYSSNAKRGWGGVIK